MNRLGTAQHVVQRKLIVRTDPIEASDVLRPKLNSVVVNHKRMKIGKVSEIFGPVDRPYIVVKPFRNVDVSFQLGKRLYVEESRFSGRNRKN